MSRKLKPEFELAKHLPGRSQMERVIAARAYINQAGPRDGDKQAEMELHAFMAIFHPEYSDAQVKEMSRDMRDTRYARTSRR